jgi:hypothetical protein
MMKHISSIVIAVDALLSKDVTLSLMKHIRQQRRIHMINTSRIIVLSRSIYYLTSRIITWNTIMSTQIHFISFRIGTDKRWQVRVHCYTCLNDSSFLLFLFSFVFLLSRLLIIIVEKQWTQTTNIRSTYTLWKSCICNAHALLNKSIESCLNGRYSSTIISNIR